MKILLATANKNKIEELKEILSKSYSGKNFEFLTLDDFPSFTMPEETGKTIMENAVLKAISAAQACKIAALADDTGLEVTALNGEPGVRSARYAGESCNAQENNRKLLAELEGLFLGQREARFVTVAALATPQGEVKTAEGILEGFIGFEYRGKNGFGYDPIFIVKGKGKTLAEMTEQEKNEISHRKMAFSKILS